MIINKLNELKTKQSDRLAFLDDISPKKVDAHVDNLFPNLNVAQRIFLKRLAKLVLFLERRI